MKKLLFIIFICLGCNDVSTYQTQISIKNKLNKPIEVRLYPKAEYSQRDSYLLYNGNTMDNVFIVQPGREYNIISKPIMGGSPIEILNERFDSLEIYTSTKILKFTPKKTENYNGNLFEELKIWEYQKNEREFPTQFKRNTVIFNDYYFHIDSTKIN